MVLISYFDDFHAKLDKMNYFEQKRYLKGEMADNARKEIRRKNLVCKDSCMYFELYMNEKFPHLDWKNLYKSRKQKGDLK